MKLSADTGEWGLIELQGELETKHNISYDNLRIGDLHCSGGSTASLVVGHHLLTGKVVVLDPPLAVLKKQTAEKDAGSATEYTVAAFIRKKFLFKNRPKPLVSTVDVK